MKLIITGLIISCLVMLGITFTLSLASGSIHPFLYPTISLGWLTIAIGTDKSIMK